MKHAITIFPCRTEEKNVPFASILIVNYNGVANLGQMFDECIQSVLETDYPKIEVLIVDNASTDGSVSHVREKFGSDTRLKVVGLDKNYGYSGGVNRGFKCAKGEIIAVLNTDVSVTPNWLKEAVRMLLSKENVGIVTSKIAILEPYLETAGGEIDILLVANDRTVGTRKLSLKCFHPSGAAFIIRRKVVQILREVFDSQFFAYFDDVDLGWRCQMLKFDVLYCPTSLVFHKRGGSFGVTSPFKFYLMRKNALSSATKNLSAKNALKLLPLWLLSSLYASYLFYKTSGSVDYLTSGLKVISGYLSDFKNIWNKHVLMHTLCKTDDTKIFAKFSNTLYVDRPNTVMSLLGFALVKSWLKICRINVEIMGFKIYPTLELMNKQSSRT